MIEKIDAFWTVEKRQHLAEMQGNTLFEWLLPVVLYGIFKSIVDKI